MGSQPLRLNWVLQFVHLPELSTRQTGRPLARKQAVGGSAVGLSVLDVGSAVATGWPLGVGVDMVWLECKESWAGLAGTPIGLVFYTLRRLSPVSLASNAYT